MTEPTGTDTHDNAGIRVPLPQIFQFSFRTSDNSSQLSALSLPFDSETVIMTQIFESIVSDAGSGLITTNHGYTLCSIMFQNFSQSTRRVRILRNSRPVAPASIFTSHTLSMLLTRLDCCLRLSSCSLKIVFDCSQTSFETTNRNRCVRLCHTNDTEQLVGLRCVHPLPSLLLSWKSSLLVPRRTVFAVCHSRACFCLCFFAMVAFARSHGGTLHRAPWVQRPSSVFLSIDSETFDLVFECLIFVQAGSPELQMPGHLAWCQHHQH